MFTIQPRIYTTCSRVINPLLKALTVNCEVAERKSENGLSLAVFLEVGKLNEL